DAIAVRGFRVRPAAKQPLHTGEVIRTDGKMEWCRAIRAFRRILRRTRNHGRGNKNQNKCKLLRKCHRSFQRRRRIVPSAVLRTGLQLSPTALPPAYAWEL